MIKFTKSQLSGLAVCLGLLSSSAFANSNDTTKTTNSSQITSSDPNQNFKLNLATGLLKKFKINSAQDQVEPKFGYNGNKKLGLFLDDIIVSGTLRFFTLYRNMDSYYSDMRTSARNISFVDYPTGGAAVAQGSYPLLELNLQSKLTRNMDFNMGYSFAYYFTGDEKTDQTRNLSAIQNLRFGANLNTTIGKFSFSAGQILPVKLSKFTMGQPNYRDDYFDRLPWDWYRNSFLRYDEYYTLKMNMGGQNEGRSLFSGAVITGNILPLGVNVTALLGRTSLTAPYNSYAIGSPAILYGGRVEKSIFTKDVNGKIGLNGYFRRGYASNTSNINDNNSMYTIDSDLKFKGFKISGEIGVNKLDNPYSKESGKAARIKADFDKKYLPIPIAIEGYYITNAFANYDGSILNGNGDLRQGGSSTLLTDDPTLFTNLMQESGQYANNRLGGTLNTNLRFKKLTVDIGYSLSQEIENVNDSVITVQHKVNAFTRSRFNQWRMQTGPYGRVRSVFRRTFENIGITNPSYDHKKAYQAGEVMLMYKAKLFGKDIVLMNFNTYSAATPKLDFGSVLNENAYVRQHYSDFTVAYKFLKKVTGVLNGAYETVKGGKNTVKDSETGGYINQTGYSYGAGIDYDFISTGSLHLRHKWFDHNDTNFKRDKFKGQETYLELKIFF